jgi:hypothetical protein
MSLIDINKLPSESAPEYVTTSVDHASQLHSITANTGDREVYEILEASYTTLLTEDIVKGDKQLIRTLFTQDKVLGAMSRVVSTKYRQFTYEQRVYLNKILYSMIMNNTADNEYSHNMLMSIATENNHDQVMNLNRFLPNDVSATLAVMRYSSFKEMNNVRRLNDAIMKSLKPADNTEQIIVNIYDVLYPRVTYLFEGIMIDVKDRSKLSEDEREIYGIQGLAILDVIEQMPVPSIHKVLKTFYGDLHMIFEDCPTRFSLFSIAACDYPRITEVNRQLSAGSAIAP